MAQLNRSFSKVAPTTTLAIATVMAVSAAVSSANACDIRLKAAPGEWRLNIAGQSLRSPYKVWHEVKFDHKTGIGYADQSGSPIALSVPGVAKLSRTKLRSANDMQAICVKKLKLIAKHSDAATAEFRITDCRVGTVISASDINRVCSDKWKSVNINGMKRVRYNNRTSSLSDEWNVMRPATVAASMDMNNVARVGANEAPVQLFRPEDNTKGPAPELRIAG